MKIKIDNLWLCDDCLLTSQTDYVCDDEARDAEVRAALAELGPDLVPGFDSETGDGIKEFSWSSCDCCGSGLGGQRHLFVLLS